MESVSTDQDTYGAFGTERNSIINPQLYGYSKANLAMLLNERKCRLIVYSAILITWTLSRFIILTESATTIKPGGGTGVGVEDYEKIFYSGYCIGLASNLLTGIIALSPAIINNKILAYINVVFSLAAACLIMVATFKSKEDFCFWFDDVYCQTGYIAPNFMGSLLLIAVGIDV
eukprot:UN03936